MSQQCMHTIRNVRAFTLVELLVCITIVAVLAGIISPILISAKRSAYIAQDTSNLRQCGVALELYASDHDTSHTYSVKTLSKAGYLPKSICSSQLDVTQRGIANNIAAEIHHALPTFDEETEFFWSNPSWITFGQFQSGFERKLGAFSGLGWMVSVANCNPENPDRYLGIINGSYLRLELDGSVVRRNTTWPVAPGTIGPLHIYTPYLLFADIPENQLGGLIGD